MFDEIDDSNKLKAKVRCSMWEFQYLASSPAFNQLDKIELFEDSVIIARSNLLYVLYIIRTAEEWNSLLFKSETIRCYLNKYSSIKFMST